MLWSSARRALASLYLLAAMVGVLCGAASALFLTLLERVTTARSTQPSIVYALPLAGLLIGLAYERYGAPLQRGTNLAIEAVRGEDTRVPRRMAPMVLVGTLLTHLFGGSAGREGTAVQMGASMADWLARGLRVSDPLRPSLIAAGVAGGFGSVFGTPCAGVVFALEFSRMGELSKRALLPSVIAAVVGNATTHALGVGHTRYVAPPHVPLTAQLLLGLVALALALALTTATFIELTAWLKREGVRLLPRLPLRMALGGALVVLLYLAAGSDDYLGLGLPMLGRAFVDPTLPPYAFAAKLLFTAITLAAGFLGGEVTPLFFVGATLGNALAAPLGLPLPLAAGLGMAGAFAAASNTPLALTVMAVELLGADVLPHALIVCTVAYVAKGQRSIYAAQCSGS